MGSGQRLGISGFLAQRFLQTEITPLLALVGLLLGLFAILVTPREEEPQIDVTFANVFIAYPGASALEVEQLVSTPMERILSEIDGVEHIYSVSRPGNSILTVQFEVGEPRDEAIVRLYNAVYSNHDWMPAGVGVLPALINLQRISQDTAAQMGLASPQNLLLIAGQGQHLALAAAGSNLLVLAGGKGFRDDLLSSDGVELAQAGAALLPAASPRAVPESAPPGVMTSKAPKKAGSAHAQKAPSPAVKARPKVEQIPRDTPADANLEALLKEAAPLPKENLDDFWNTLAEEQPALKTSQDVLTWEEARKLGLTQE